VRHYCEPGDLVIFDVDNTLAHPKGRIGSDEWFVFLVQEQMQQGKTLQEALQIVLPIYCEVQYGIELHPVDPIAPALIEELQREGVYVMALTARSLPLMQRTIEQLAAIGIDFAHNHLGDPVIVRQLVDRYIYKRGILFSGQNNKGLALLDFLAYCNLRPKKIIFVDDKLSNLVAVMDAVATIDVPFVGIRYGLLDEYVATINAQAVHEELLAFYHI
jgi:phosphoglycolate phosphatase-like HAD superfamily hydrolase